jgi:hypothetical protein
MCLKPRKKSSCRVRRGRRRCSRFFWIYPPPLLMDRCPSPAAAKMAAMIRGFGQGKPCGIFSVLLIVSMCGHDQEQSSPPHRIGRRDPLLHPLPFLLVTGGEGVVVHIAGESYPSRRIPWRRDHLRPREGRQSPCRSSSSMAVRVQAVPLCLWYVG